MATSHCHGHPQVLAAVPGRSSSMSTNASSSVFWRSACGSSTRQRPARGGAVAATVRGHWCSRKDPTTWKKAYAASPAEKLAYILQQRTASLHICFINRISLYQECSYSSSEVRYQYHTPFNCSISSNRSPRLLLSDLPASIRTTRITDELGFRTTRFLVLYFTLQKLIR